MPSRLITPPTIEPITLEEAQIFLRVVTDDDGDFNDAELIGDLIRDARIWVERVTRRALIAQTWELALNAFPAGTHDAARIVLYPAPLYLPAAIEPEEGEPEPPEPSPIVSIQYRDAAGAWQIVPTTDYEYDLILEPGEVYPVPDVAWPATQTRRNAVLIRYMAGYGVAGSDVPAPLRDAIKSLVSHGYEYREAGVMGSLTSMPFGVEEKLLPYRLMDLA